MMLLDNEVAFPSSGWPWMRFVLGNAGAPRWVIEAISALYHGTRVRITLNGDGTAEFIEVALGSSRDAQLPSRSGQLRMTQSRGYCPAVSRLLLAG